MIISRTYTFEAAHHLPRVPDGHKCKRMHGHTWSVEVQARGVVDPESGFVLDFFDIDAAWAPIHDALDHHCINDLIENPTSENLAIWIWERLAPAVPLLSQVTVQETPSTACVYDGPAHG